MGCWNQTCMISQLPILHGQEIALILLQRQTDKLYSEGTCYCDTYFKPYPMILYGEYDDYGGIKNAIGDIDIFFEIIENTFKCNEEDIIDSYINHHRDYNDNCKISAYLQFIINSDRYSEYHNENIGFVMIHKKLFDKLKLTKSWDFGWGEPKEKIVNKYYDIFTFEKKLKKIQDENDIFNFIIKDRMNNNTNFAKINLTNVNKKSISDLLGIMYALNPLRQSWMPQTGMGSQMQIEKPNKILSEFYSEMIKKYEKEDDNKYE